MSEFTYSTMYRLFGTPAKHYRYRRAIGFFLQAFVTCASRKKHIVTTQFEGTSPGHQGMCLHATGSAAEPATVWILEKDLDVATSPDILKRFKDLDKARFAGSSSTSHNVYCVKKETQHYMQCQPVQEESLLDKVCAGAAFLLCVALLIFWG